MAGNPLVQQGQINRLVAAVSWDDFPNLGIIASYLAKEGIRLTLEGETTQILPTMTGIVPSPEPYQMITMTAALIKSQPLSAAYQAQMQISSFIGNGTVFPDVAAGLGLAPYRIFNASIYSVPEQNYSGDSVAWTVVCRGYYNINSSLYG